MTINERLDAAKAALVEAKDADDAEALSCAIAEFKAATEAKEQADEADSLIKSLSNPKEEKPMEPITEAKTIGEYALKNLDLSAIRNGAAKTAGTEYGFKAYTDPQVSQTVNTYSTDVADQGLRDLAVRGLFGAEQISGNAITFFTLGAKEDNSAPSPKGVNEAAAKPQFHIVEGTVTKPLQKIAGWFYETDELLEDNPYLATALNNRGLYELDAAVEDYLLTTLAATSGIGAKTYAHNGNVNPDVILDAIMDVKKDTRFNADAIIINPNPAQAQDRQRLQRVRGRRLLLRPPWQRPDRDSARHLGPRHHRHPQRHRWHRPRRRVQAGRDGRDQGWRGRTHRGPHRRPR